MFKSPVTKAAHVTANVVDTPSRWWPLPNEWSLCPEIFQVGMDGSCSKPWLKSELVATSLVLHGSLPRLMAAITVDNSVWSSDQWSLLLKNVERRLGHSAIPRHKATRQEDFRGWYDMSNGVYVLLHVSWLGMLCIVKCVIFWIEWGEWTCAPDTPSGLWTSWTFIWAHACLVFKTSGCQWC